jgi:hypothetical protein
MKSWVGLFLLIFCLTSTGLSRSGEEKLYLVNKRSVRIDELISSSGVNIYAVLNDDYLIGTDPREKSVLETRDPAVEFSGELGTRQPLSDYYFLQKRQLGADHLIDLPGVIWSDEDEIIIRIRIDAGEAIRSRFPELLDGAVRISFVPMVRPDLPAEELRVDAVIDPQIQLIVDQVDQAQFTAYIQRLQDFVTRYSETDSCRAAELWALDTFASLGLETELFPYDFYGHTWYNAIGRKIGRVFPDSIYLIMGHIDDTSEMWYFLAPGAEDNASGSACVLEAARILSAYDFDCTIEFVLVSGEELGLIGSQAYAEYCYNQNRNIAGVLNFDMISYAGSYGWDTNIYADQYFPAEIALANALAQLTDLYSEAYSIRVDTEGPVWASDHYYFSYYGFPAPYSVDAQLWKAPDWYPWYHTTDDVIDHLDLDFGTEVVKGAVATLATLAHPSTPLPLEFIFPDGLPEVVNPNGGTSFRVEVNPGSAVPEPGTGLLHYNTGGGFTAVPMEIISSNVYDAVFPALECGVVVSFYVSSETDSGLVVTDPPNAPTRVYVAFSAYQVVRIFEDNFSTNKGWTGLGGPGEWTIGPTRGGPGDDAYGGADPSVDHSPSGDNRVLGSDLTANDGDYEANLGSTFWVISPPMDCTNYLGVTLRFYRWLGVEENEYDHAYLQGFNGVSWVTLFENTFNTIDDGAWTEMNYDLSDVANGNPDFQVRFGIGVTDGALQYCGWNIDDIEISGYSCQPIADVTTELTPDDDPTIVPQGGSFGMTASITSNESVATTTDVWLGAYRSGRWFQQLLFRDVPLAAGQTRQAHFTQNVPPAAPPGEYSYVEFCGDYETWSVADSSFFPVTVIEGK